MVASLDVMVAATPASRDRYMDLLRAVSIATVVFGHWLITTIQWPPGLLKVDSVLGTAPGLWAGTWLFQVMPIFFFVGGFANVVAYRSMRAKGLRARTFIWSRVKRLLKPSLVFLGLWTVAQIVMHLADLGQPAGVTLWGDTKMLRGFLPPAQTLPFGPMWFLAVYLIVVAIAPMTIWLHDRLGWIVPLTFAGLAVVVDVIGFGFDQHGLRYWNVAFLLLFPHQLGHLYADGRFGRSRVRMWGMVVGGIGALVVLTNDFLWKAIAPEQRFEWFLGMPHYPRSLLGTGTEPISNAYPPTVCFLAAGIWTIGAAMLLRGPATRWLQRARNWKLVIAVNSIVMTLFLWHMTAFLFAILVLWPLGLGREQTASIRWWLEKPLFLAVGTAFLAGLIAIFGRFERPGRAPT